MKQLTQKNPENLQVDYRFHFSNLIFRPCYKKKIKRTPDVYIMYARQSVTDNQRLNHLSYFHDMRYGSFYTNLPRSL